MTKPKSEIDPAAFSEEYLRCNPGMRAAVEAAGYKGKKKGAPKKAAAKRGKKHA